MSFCTGPERLAAAQLQFDPSPRCYAADMRRFSIFILLSLAFSSLLIPGVLWIYQGFQFDSWLWDLGRMTADRIVVTSAKGGLFAMAIAAALVFRPQVFLGHSARKSM